MTPPFPVVEDDDISWVCDECPHGPYEENLCPGKSCPILDRVNAGEEVIYIL